jgi:Uncharacterized protein conserved in archaea
MNTWITRAALGIPAVALGLIGWTVSAQAAPTPTPTPVPSVTATADANLTANLTFMREEERLAHDVYTALATKYPTATVFANIATSEQRHYESMGLLLQRYGLTDPAAGRDAGSYANAELQSLYTSLVADGSTSVADAYQVGITIETKDIADLKSAIAQTSAADATAVFTNLLNGSQNHLASFTAAKDGKILGARNGQGMQNGRNRTDQTAGTMRGQGGGARQGWTGSQQRPATCPLS